MTAVVQLDLELRRVADPFPASGGLRLSVGEVTHDPSEGVVADPFPASGGLRLFHGSSCGLQAGRQRR